MGGYTRPKRIYRLRFEDEDMAGLIVRARSLPLGQFLALTGLVKVDPKDLEPAQLAGLFEGFAGCLVSWNLTEEDGAAVPPTLEGIYSQDPDFVIAIVTAWIDAVANVDSPLGPTSNGGRPSGAVPMPMEVLSANP